MNFKKLMVVAVAGLMLAGFANVSWAEEEAKPVKKAKKKKTKKQDEGNQNTSTKSKQPAEFVQLIKELDDVIIENKIEYNNWKRDFSDSEVHRICGESYQYSYKRCVEDLNDRTAAGMRLTNNQKKKICIKIDRVLDRNNFKPDEESTKLLYKGCLYGDSEVPNIYKLFK